MSSTKQQISKAYADLANTKARLSQLHAERSTNIGLIESLCQDVEETREWIAELESSLVEDKPRNDDGY